jgi:iron(III) transport system ATP-binding protein
LREEMRIELRRLQQQIGVTTIYVTHDQSEALAMSDRIAVMDKGRVVQIGDPREIYFRPANEFVASFIGAANLLSGICDGAVPAGAMGAVRLGDGSRIHCLFPAGGVSGHATTVSVRPESIVLATGPCDETALRGVVNSASFLGGSVRYDVQVGDIVVRVVGQAEQVVPQGTAVGLTFPASSAVSVG